jgi:hypothetical protein
MSADAQIDSEAPTGPGEAHLSEADGRLSAHNRGSGDTDAERQAEADAICDLIERKRLRTRVERELKRRHPRRKRPKEEVTKRVQWIQRQLEDVRDDELENPDIVAPLQMMQAQVDTMLGRVKGLLSRTHSQSELGKVFGQSQQAIQKWLRRKMQS